MTASEMRNQELASGQHPGDDHREQPPTLTIAEAAKACGVSASTIRRYLRAGRFPSARREPSPAPGRSWQWRIPPEELPAAGLNRRRPPSGHGQEHQSRGEPAGGRPAEERIRVLQDALELERIRRQAAEALIAEQARTIARLMMALRALEHHRPEPVPDQPVTATSASPRAGVGVEQTPEPAPRPDSLRMVPTPRRARGELSQEERAAIIGRALSRERPAKRRWWRRKQP
jgi:excisionase family DNA binding protein